VGKGSSGGGAASAPTASGGRTPVREAGGIAYKKSQAAVDAGDVLVKVDVGKLDRAWQKDRGFYVPPGGGADKQKYANAREYVGRKGAKVDAPRVHLDRSGTASFTDGRHRAAAVRDAGKRSLYVTVSRGQADRVRRDLGA
jgi:hypothetical protein